jgi:RNA polymerase sigma-19 factor, ECF subfamily
VPAEPLYREKALLDQIAQGDENAFRTIFDHYRDNIYSFALKVLRHEAMAEETVQDVFLKIWINRAGLSAIRNFADFLFIVARNHTFNSLRRLARERKISSVGPEDLQIEGVSAEATVLQRDYDRVLQQAVALLPPQQKLVYTLSRQHGLSREEIAEQMNISAGTVKAHMGQALRSIRTYFKTHENSILCLIAAVLLNN